MDFSIFAKKVTENTNIQTSSKDIERLIGAIRKTFKLWDIVDLSDCPVPVAFEAIKILNENDIVSLTKSEVSLTDKGLLLSEKLHPCEDLTCRVCEGRGLDLDAFKDIYEKFLEIQKNRPEAVHHFDQGYVTPSSTFSRFLIGYERGDIFGKDVLILGDDDLLSIVLGLTGTAKSITVFEIDERLIDFIKNTAAKEGFDVTVTPFDLRQPLPSYHTSTYDTFFTDPPETLPAADAFVGRGITALKAAGSAGYFGFTRREASLTKWYNIQLMLLEYRVVITDVIHNFNEYVNWGYEEDTRAWRLAPVKVLPDTNWYRSALFRIETLEGFSGNTKGYGDENIYEDVESSTT